tara:strand:- start:8623 stop:9588 length:966 start_codon:yes stop_codon:yes gene_type:complete
MSNKIIIVFGDPNSINSEIIYKSWKKLSFIIKRKIYLISNFELLEKQFKKLRYKIKLKKVKDLSEKVRGNELKVIDIELNFSDPFKVEEKSASKFVIKSLNLAHKLALTKDVCGIINCPINKKLLKRNNIGVTEFLAKKCKINNESEVMLIYNDKFSVTPITTHINVKNISKRLSSSILFKKIKTIDNWFANKKNIKPKIGVLGLNPHNAELKASSEEKKIIIPTLKKLKKLNFRVDGPLVADTIFIKDYKKYNVIVGMYHDQVLIPFKTLFKFDAINITLGLRYLRVSPDHGTALNLIGKKIANYHSLKRCIEFINKFGK